MNVRLFFLDKEGWFEEEITAKLLNSSNEELLQWTYAMMDKHGYRNYLITENRDRDTVEIMNLPAGRQVMNDDE